MRKLRLKLSSLKPFQFYRATISFKSNKTVAPNILVANMYAEYTDYSHYMAIKSAERFAKSIEIEGDKIRVIVGIKVSNITLNHIDESGNMNNKEKIFYQWQDKKGLKNKRLFKV